ncbi:MAG: hypothetical protein AB8G77_24025 [Rhodothermales bacterium]
MHITTKICAFICTTLFLAGCAISVNLPDGFDGTIPEKANRVDVTSEQSVEELFETLQEWLPAQGFSIESANELSRTIETTSAEIGQRTRMKIKLRISPHELGSHMEAIGTWSSDVEESTFSAASQNVSSEENDWYVATWSGKTRSSYAYSQLITTFHDLPAIDKRYVKQ